MRDKKNCHPVRCMPKKEKYEGPDDDDEHFPCASDHFQNGVGIYVEKAPALGRE